MLAIPKRKFLERIDVLPEAIRNIAFSAETGNLLWAIGKTYHLDDRKIDSVVMLTAAVLFGFLHHTDLAKEIQDATRLDPKIAQLVSEEIKQKVFARVEATLNEIYEPVLSAEETAEERAESVQVEIPSAAPAAVSVPFSLTPPKVPSTETRRPPSGPLILHEEKGVAAEAQKGFKGFSMPLSFLRSKMAANATSKAAARVEMPPTTAPPPRKDEPRVVHYNENRTPLSPFGQNEEFINLETFEKFTPPSPGYGRASSPFPGYGRTSPLPAVSIKPSVEETPLPSPIPAPPIQPAPPAPVAEPTLRIITEPAPKIVPEPQTPAPAKNPVPPPAPEGGEPKLKGNTVDLR